MTTAKSKCNKTLVFNVGNLSTAILLIIGICLNPKPDDGWQNAIAGPLFETACIYWLYQALFFQENPLTENERLGERIA